MAARYHTKALDPQIDEVRYRDRMYQRSLYGHILMYNRLPQCVVDSPSVKTFQAKLTHIAKQQAMSDQSKWRRAYQSMADVNEICYNNIVLD